MSTGFHEPAARNVTAPAPARRIRRPVRGAAMILPALGNFGGEMRLLQRRDRDRTLADAHADGLARKPHLIGLAA